jgi:hypothetical protein
MTPRKILNINPFLLSCLPHSRTLVFDREGYSPGLFLRLRRQRVAILTYHKHPGPDWPQGEFSPRLLTHPNGETTTVPLAEHGTAPGNGLWVRELRRLDERGHQTAVLSTDCRSQLDTAAAAMFARWNQENFFKYMRQHHGLDRLAEYGTSPLPDTTRLVNPAWRALDSQVRRVAGELARRQAAFSAEVLRPAENNPAAAARHEQRQGAALQALQAKQTELAALKARRKDTPKHVELADLPPDQRVAQLRGARKHFVDTIKLVAYRAETALVQLARETLRRADDARSFVRGLMRTTINLRPDPVRAELLIELHGQTNPAHDAVVDHLCAELNATETHYPGTALRLKYVPLRSTPFPAGQDV